MAKSKKRNLRKFKAAPTYLREHLQDENDRRVGGLVKTAKARQRVAKHFATMFGLTADNVPAGLEREFRKAAEAAAGARLPRVRRK